MKRKLIINVGSIVGVVLVSFLIVTFVLRSHKAQTAVRPQSTIQQSLASAISKPLPTGHLVDLKGQELKASELTQGKVMLVLLSVDCDFCKDEGQFLKSRIDRRKDMRFYGVISFGEKRDLIPASERFPFSVYFDDGGRIRDALGIDRAPVKLYVENGIVKKTWIGSTTFHHDEKGFDEWLDSLS
jgi:hypothetical protein